MTLLAELFDRLENTPPELAQQQAGVLLDRVEVGATAPAFPTRQKPADAPPAPAAPIPAPTPALAAEAASEPVRNAWTITRGGEPICRMVGAPCTRTEALAEARWRWPDADILES